MRVLVADRAVGSCAVVATLALMVLVGCGAPQPSESQIQIAVSNCFVINLAEMDETTAVHTCSDELGTIGDRAFVKKYPVLKS